MYLKDKMGKKAQEIWEEALPLLRSKLGPRNYETWFHGTKGIALQEGAITVSVPNKFCKDWIEDKYAPVVKEVIREAGPEEMEVQFVVEAGGGAVTSEEKPEEKKEALIVE